MQVAVAQQITPTTERLANLARLLTLLSTTSEIHLYQAPVTPIDAEVVLSDLVEADYDGYAAFDPATWSTPFLAPDLTAVILSGSHVFEATGATTPNMIYGAYLTTAAAAALIAVFPFDAPQPMGADGDVIPLVVQYHMPLA